jgi:hypothetical protein
MHHQEAILILRHDLLLGHRRGQTQRPDELPDRALANQIALGLILRSDLPLSGNRQHLTGEVDVQILLVDARDLEPHDVLGRGLYHVHDRDPVRPRGLIRERRKERLGEEPGGEQTIEYPIELLTQLPHNGVRQRHTHNTSR